MNKLSITLVSLTTTSLLALGAPALASHGGGGGGGGGNGAIVKTGTCSDGARWKLKAKPDDSFLEVEGEVDSNQTGQAWAWKIKDNGAVAAKGSATTAGRSGSFSVSRKIANQPGTDTVVFRAKFAGQLCTGTIAL